MYVDAGHPSKYVMMEIGRQIMKLLKIKNDVDESKYVSFLGMPAPVPESVKRCWEINYEVEMEPRKSFLYSSQTQYDKITYIKEYIAEYIWWTHSIRVKE